MNEFQFCYWLMGVFELGNPKEFSNKQLVLISEHLKLVEFRNYTFCNWLDGFLDANGLEGMREDKLMKVLEKLRYEFYSVIDKSYPKEMWDPLQKAHDGEKVNYEKPKVEKPRIEALC